MDTAQSWETRQMNNVMDLNADLGEGYGIWRLGDDVALLELVTSANVACGFHAGDPLTILRASARRQRPRRGDRRAGLLPRPGGFGRREMDVPRRAVLRRPLPARRA